MELKLYSLIYLFLTSLVLISLLWFWPDQQLHLINCNVGQGDAYLITRGFTQILVDGGKDKQVLDCLDKFIPYWDRQIEFVIASHDDNDHIGGLAQVMYRYHVANLVWNGKDSNSKTWQNIQKLAKSQSTKQRVAYEQNLLINQIKLDFLWPQSKPSFTDEDNLSSVVTKISYHDFSIMFTGDIDTLTEEKVISGSVALDSSVLKVSHHGSRFATSDKWLKAVNPQIAFIGVGSNSYGHPNLDVLTRIKNNNIILFRTDNDGTVEIVSDGRAWQVASSSFNLNNLLSRFVNKNLY